MEYQATLKKSEISALWNKYGCSKQTQTRLRRRDIKSNLSTKRILFVLIHYKLWTIAAAKSALNLETDCMSMCALLSLLTDYNRASIIDDFNEIKILIEGRNKHSVHASNCASIEDETETETETESEIDIHDRNNNHNLTHHSMYEDLGHKHNGREIHPIRQYFQLCLGKCVDISKCISVERNLRNRETDADVNERRRSFYIREEALVMVGDNNNRDSNAVIAMDDCGASANDVDDNNNNNNRRDAGRNINRNVDGHPHRMRVPVPAMNGSPRRINRASDFQFEANEINLQSYLDVLHNYLLHRNSEHYSCSNNNTFQQKNINKFVTHMVIQPADPNHNHNNTNTNTNANEHHPSVDSSHAQNSHHQQPQSQNNSIDIANNIQNLGEYSFGTVMDYWKASRHDFVSAKYPDLKSEFLNNTIHSIPLFIFQTLELNAFEFSESIYIHGLRCKREVVWMEVNGKQLIPINSLISVSHLMSVLSYTNHTDMQYEYKRKGFRKLSANESTFNVRKRNAEIAHWSRLLCEVIHCFGTVMSRKRPLYHGISCKMLFSEFSTIFEMPTSLTVNGYVARQFAQHTGMILQLKHAGQADDISLMFDVSIMSNFPREEERLIFHSRAQFDDIILNGMSHKLWLKVLKHWEKIRFGRFLSHVSCSKASQSALLCLIENFVEHHENVQNRKKNNSNNGRNTKRQKNSATAVNMSVDYVFQNGHVPNYIQLLFNQSSVTRKYISINERGIKRIIKNKKLVKHFNLRKKNNVYKSKLLNVFETIRSSFVYDWKIRSNEYVRYFSNSHPWVKSEKYRIFVSDKNGTPDVFQLEFHFELQNAKRNNLLRCSLDCDYLPEEIAKIEVYSGIFICETRSEEYSIARLHHSKKYALTLHSIVNSHILLPENNTTIKKREFNVKLMINIWKIHYA